MDYCQECQQPCRDPYVTDGKPFCRNCYEMLTARWTRNWDPHTFCEWRDTDKKRKQPSGIARPGMDYKRSHLSREELDG